MTPTLRLIQTVEHTDTFHIAVELIGAGPRLTANAHFTFMLSEQERQDIRWYLEEYAEYPFAPHPERAARIEHLMHEVGVRLFRHLFEQENQEGQRRIWAKVYEHLSTMRVEIISTPQEATALPWELLCDPFTKIPVALNAKSFVRAHPESLRQARSVQADPPIRVLLVICRPSGRTDVPFRSVASRLLKGLSEEARKMLQLDVLRPPTFEQLSEVLRMAHQRGEPYHVVHFDGHGVYDELKLLHRDIRIRSHTFRVDGPQGFLLFEHENPTQRLIHGIDLGNLLHETGVPLLVLNACRSAYTDEVPESESTSEQQNTENPYNKVRAFGSLAQQVMLQGVTGVVAMRYNVYVVTAAQFVANLYASLTRGLTLGAAVTYGRKQLAANRQRHIVQPIELQDWMVPVVYEAEPVQLFTQSSIIPDLTINISSANVMPKRGMLDEHLPPEPDVGFFGRDETLLALDRGFDKNCIILLHSYAGSGKTTTAAEFARWYSLTGGVNGPVLFTSFEYYRPPVQLLDQVGQLFDPPLRQKGVHWDTISDKAQKRSIVFQLLKQIPVLWLWDNVESVTGFPAGTPSTWTTAEQQELLAFLRDIRDTKTKVLLTSRRDEQHWLGNLPARVMILPMPMHERQQLAEALASKRNMTFDQFVWRPLLLYSNGNPLTLTVIVGQALRDGLRTAQQIATYVEQLQAGEAIFDDDANQGRSHSLGASLNYGFEASFSTEERRVLALLYHFQGFVCDYTVRLMSNPQTPGHLPTLVGLTREQVRTLLDRASEGGLLTSLGNGAYRIHPALPWFFRRLYEEYYPDNASGRAFVEAIAALGNHYWNRYNHGKREFIVLLKAEEANLLHACRQARQQEWYEAMIQTIQALQILYSHTGRQAEWRRLFEEILPTFVDPMTNDPLPGREKMWSVIIQYHVLLYEEVRQWSEAVRLQSLIVASLRQQAAPLLHLSLEQLSIDQRNTLRSLSASLHQLGRFQCEQGNSACVGSLQESYELSRKLDDQAGAATSAFSIGRAYKELPSLRDLGQVEYWYKCGLELTPQSDMLMRGKGLVIMGNVSWTRFDDDRIAQQADEVLVKHLNTALAYYQQARSILPSYAVDDLAAVNNGIGLVYDAAGELERAVTHYCEAIRYREIQGNLSSAGSSRENVARAYADAGRFEEALLFAQAALKNFEEVGPGVVDRVVQVRQLIAAIRRGDWPRSGV